MKIKTICSAIILLTGLLTFIKAEPVMVNQVGAGARAYSLANNYVALSNDVSGVFWNPAALSFLPIREFQISIDGLDNHNSADFHGTNEVSDVRRLRMSNVGYLLSIPATQGGLSVAATVQTPYIFDDNPTFNGVYSNVKNQTIQIQQDYKGYGGLTLIGGAFGIQLAPGFGIGASVSIVSGSEKIHRIVDQKTNGVWLDVINDDYDYTAERKYIGYDCRLGLFYAPASIIRLGMRFSLPQQIWFDENISEVYPGDRCASLS
jgi:hypothetical protein